MVAWPLASRKTRSSFMISPRRCGSARLTWPHCMDKLIIQEVVEPHHMVMNTVQVGKSFHNTTGFPSGVYYATQDTAKGASAISHTASAPIH